MGARLALTLTLVATLARAQAVVPERELEVVRQNFNVGNYKEALARALHAMEVSNFNDAQRGELHKFAGLSSFNLGELAAAEKHFLALLQLNPDFVLDPFAFPPPAIRLFEEVKKKNADTLNLIRQQIALRDEQARREAVEREKARVLAEEQRRRLEELSKQATIRTVEKRAFVVNFLPFGAGQFQQGRNGFGILFAIFEGAAAATSIVAYWALESLFQYVTYDFRDRVYPFSVTTRQIPERRRAERNAWGLVKNVSGIAFYSAWGIGVADALWHHQDEVVSTETRRLEEIEPGGPGRGPRTLDLEGGLPPPPLEAPRVFLFPTSGGIGAGFSMRF